MLKNILQESMNGNALGLKEALQEELKARVAIALSNKISESEELDEISQSKVSDYAERSFRQANTILKRSLDDQPKSVQKASAAALERRKKGIKMSGKRLPLDLIKKMADDARYEKY